MKLVPLETLAQALELRRKVFKRTDKAPEIIVTPGGKVFVRLKITAQDFRISDLSGLLGMSFAKERTWSNRVRYVHDFRGMQFLVHTDLPFCDGSEFVEEMRPAKRSYYVCPIEGQDAEVR